MANEFLKRTPTSTGNRRVFTWAGWVKLNVNNVAWLFTATPVKDNVTLLYVNTNGVIYFFDRQGSDPTSEQVRWNPQFRDLSSWKHIIINADTTKGQASERVKCYVNGVMLERDETGSLLNNSVNVNTPAQDQEFWRLNGSGYVHYIGARLDNSLDTQNKNQFTDIFYVDGQQLDPEVFGFYKDGNGYISAGTTQATDFRNGQWVPRTPREIKNLINDNGGFGVNGFYLPMNDSSNFGADFHTTPNSIITLKGENLPQPRNGAPDTTDAYVSQLRTDPYAANLVLAVPGISTATGANLITNGTFDSNVSGWTAGHANASITWDAGRMKVANTGGGVSWPYAYQAITTVIGQRYTISFLWDRSNSTDGRVNVRSDTTNTVSGSILYADLGTGSDDVISNFSFTATATTTYVFFYTKTVTDTVYSHYDNIIVKQEDAPRDYSADIKGSGTNKTLTPNGNAGVGYEIPSYYESAMTFDGSGDYFSDTYNADFNFGTSDFAVEMWVYPNTVNSIDGLFAVSGGSGSNPKMAFHLNNGTPSVHYNVLTGGANIYTASGDAIPAGQWSHLAYERKGSAWTWYINGVATGTGSNSTDITFTNQPMYIGYGGEGYFDSLDGKIQDVRVYKGIAKYKGGFDVPKPYSPIGIESWRQVSDTCKNNFMTMSTLSVVNSSANGLNLSLSDGNLTVATDGTPNQTARGSFIVSSGKWYFETTLPSATGLTTQNSAVGVVAPNIGGVDGSSGPGYSILYREAGGAFLGNGDSRSDPAAGTHATYVAGDIIGVALDIDNGDVEFFKNGVSAATYNFPTHAVSGTNWTIESLVRQADSVVVHNFGQNPTLSGRFAAGTNADDSDKGLFKYAPPSGFLALCEDNLPTPAIKDPGEYFKTVLYTGSGGSQSIKKVGFQPDLVWVKKRSTLGDHKLVDSVRGAGFVLESNTTDIEGNETINFSGFNSDGFELGNNNAGAWNEPSYGYVAWCWKAGGAAVSNTDGTITSQVSANQTAGFSIVSYTGNYTAGATIGHGLGKKPSMMIVKERDGASGWFVYHEDLGATKFLPLHSTTEAGTETGNTACWYATEPNSTVFTVGQNGATNDNNMPIIAYCWTEIEGFSKFGSFIGNGVADGPFVYCGFKPAFVLVRRALGGTGYWILWDSSRTPVNLATNGMVPNENWAETSGFDIDLLSNGFKMRDTESSLNISGSTYIFAAFAESPFQTANAK